MIAAARLAGHSQEAFRSLKDGMVVAALGVTLLVAQPADGAAMPREAVSTRSGYTVVESKPYGEGPRRSLDIYRPKNATNAPVVVFFYGGSWQGGSKKTYRFLASALARRGYVTIVPDYRVYPEIRYPSFLDDGAQAVAWSRAHAAEFGGDPDSIVLMGHSAGAYIAAMLAIDDRWLAKVGLDPKQDIAGLVGLSGPYNFLPLKSETLKTIFGGANRPETQPVNFVSGNEPPAFLGTGANDKTVDPRNAASLAERLTAAGGEAEVHRYRGVGHITLVASIAWPLRFLAPVLKDVDRFIHSVTDRKVRS